MVTPIYWHKRVISADTIGFGEGEALHKNFQHFSYSSRHRLLIKLQQAEMEIDFLHKNNTFKMQVTLDCHSPILVFQR
jgi:hypothetical protein